MSENKTISVLMDLTLAVDCIKQVIESLQTGQDARIDDINYCIQQASHKIEHMRDDARC